MRFDYTPTVIFPGNPIPEVGGPIDSAFAKEADAAKEAGFHVGYIREDGRVTLLPGDTNASRMGQAFYRGWMLSPTEYAAICGGGGFSWVTPSWNYEFAHHLPNNYDLIAGVSARSIWVPFTQGEIGTFYQRVVEALRWFGDDPVVIKDYVKSQKHYWDTACFIPKASDEKKALSVVQEFLRLQDGNLEGGLVIRQYLRLRRRRESELADEMRFFVCHGQIIPTTRPIPFSVLDALGPTLERINRRTSFYAVDVAQAEFRSEWHIIEIGDGQVTGLPEGTHLPTFYSHVRAAIEQYALDAERRRTFRS